MFLSAGRDCRADNDINFGADINSIDCCSPWAGVNDNNGGCRNVDYYNVDYYNVDYYNVDYYNHVPSGGYYDDTATSAHVFCGDLGDHS